MSDRTQGRWLAQLVELRIREGTTSELEASLGSDDRRTRRLAYRHAIDKSTLALQRLIAGAKEDSDLLIRRWCSRTCRSRCGARFQLCRLRCEFS